MNSWGSQFYLKIQIEVSYENTNTMRKVQLP